MKHAVSLLFLALTGTMISSNALAGNTHGNCEITEEQQCVGDVRWNCWPVFVVECTTTTVVGSYRTYEEAKAALKRKAKPGSSMEQGSQEQDSQ